MFVDRVGAGVKLAEKLKEDWSASTQALVLAIPRGGVPIGKEISRALGLPLDCLVIKKIPAPQKEELAIGAVGEGGVVVWEEELLRRLRVPVQYRQEIVKQKLTEFEKKENDFRAGRAIPKIQGKTIIITDDGIATGATIKAAIATVRNFQPKEIVVAVPVIAQEALMEIKQKADQVFYLESPEMFFSVDQFYEDFRQYTDEEIIAILEEP
ncbi:MAG TPA: phosphoribosyltransferase family protein [Patescibacteria group bacterium]|nr:phosphoribosyltransferase family protein [Patescibacteria group bacterium]